MNELDLLTNVGQWGLGGIALVMLGLILNKLVKQAERHADAYRQLIEKTLESNEKHTKALVNMYAKIDETWTQNARENQACRLQREDCDQTREKLARATKELDNVIANLETKKI